MTAAPRIVPVDTEKTAGCAELMAVQALCFPHDAPVNVTEGLWWIARGPTGEPAGFAGMALWAGGDPLTAYLSLAGVVPEFRGQGLQKRLIRARLTKAKQLSLRRVVTDTTTSNPASVNSLIACGFRQFLPEHPWKVPGALYWEKTLT